MEEYSTRSLREALLLLVGATRLVGARHRWTKRAWAHAADGSVVSGRPELAVRWCVAGAVVATQLRFWSGSKILYVVDQDSDAVVAVPVPQRLVAALDILGESLWSANRMLIEGRRERAEELGFWKPLPASHPTMRACAINDLPQIGYSHMRLGLGAAVTSVYEELRTRGAVWRPPAEHGAAYADEPGRSALIVDHFPSGRC